MITLPGPAASMAIGHCPSHRQAAKSHVVLRLGAGMLSVRLKFKVDHGCCNGPQLTPRIEFFKFNLSLPVVEVEATERRFLPNLKP